MFSFPLLIFVCFFFALHTIFLCKIFYIVSKAERQITNDDDDNDDDGGPIGVKVDIPLEGVFFSHLMTQDTHNLDAPMHSSWQKAPHCWQITIALREHAQFVGGLLLSDDVPPVIPTVAAVVVVVVVAETI